MLNKLQLCRICGYDFSPANYYPWGEDGLESSHDICHCCGVEFGYEDCLLAAIHRYRNLWIERGSPWLEPKEKPEGWSWERQRENIPAEFL
jgi:hypothetical protein